jgi:hypothetical protein
MPQFIAQYISFKEVMLQADSALFLSKTTPAHADCDTGYVVRFDVLINV